jgi:hypothetical protein
MFVDDEVLPAASRLLGGRAQELLVVAIEGAGGCLRRFTSEQALYRPGHDLVVRYDVLIDWGNGHPTGETLVARAGANGPPEGTMVLRDGELEVAVWRYPFDPDLPGLAAAVTPALARNLVADIVGDDVRLEVRTFRPQRRAVVEAAGPMGRAFLKVVPPADVDRLVTAHQAFAAGGLPVPEVLRADRQLGIVVLDAVPGTTLRAALTQTPSCWPAEPIVDLLGRLTEVDWPAAPPAEPGPLAHAAGHVRLLEHVVPGERDRLHRLLERIGPCDESASAEPGRVVHGDLHEAQILVSDDAAVSGLLDLDDAGLGSSADDIANLTAHLLSLALGRTAPLRRRVDVLTTELCRAKAIHTVPVELDRRIAAALIAMATGPFRARQSGWRRATAARLALAEQRLAAHGTTLDVAS